MFSLGGVALSPILALCGVVILVILVYSLFRFFLHLAWRLIGIVLTLVIIIGIVLFLMNAIHISW